MRTPTGYEQYAASHLRRPDGSLWADSSDSFCVQLVYEAGGFTGASFDNASIAANYVLQHHGLDPNYITAVRGEFHYWGTGAGHITFEAGNLNELMASSFANSLAPGLGYMPLTTYGIPTGHGHTYMGHSPYFRDQTLAAEVDPSGGGGTPVTPTQPMEINKMRLVWKSPGTVYTIIGNGAPYPFVGTGADAALFAKVWNTDIGGAAIEIPAASWDVFITANTPVSSGTVTTNLQPVLDAITGAQTAVEGSLTTLAVAVAGDFATVDKNIAAVPTAPQNGAAARAAIVAP